MSLELHDVGEGRVSSGTDAEKRLAARTAAARVNAGMRVALGSGTTTAFAIRAIAEKFPDGDSLTLVASSRDTEALARELGLPVRPLAGSDRFDVMIDGADEVTPTLALTKGGGGALFREKFLARLSDELDIVVDHSKLVPRLGVRAPIPLEVVPFARPVVLRELEERGLKPRLRARSGTTEPWLTDNGNEIIDVAPTVPLDDPAGLDCELRSLPGVVETGIFVGLAHRVYVGRPDGTVQELRPAGQRG
jgi:ribose 5-phosphate isomerase A